MGRNHREILKGLSTENRAIQIPVEWRQSSLPGGVGGVRGRGGRTSEKGE